MRIFGGIAKIAVPDGATRDRDTGDGGEPTDVELLAAHAGGDPTAFRTLLNRHYDYLWMLARRTSASPDDAADALQDALLSAHRSASSFRGTAAVRTWLHTIVINACLDRMRRERARPTVPLVEDTTEAAGHRRDRISELEVSLDVKTALAALPEEQRLAVWAVDMQNYPIKEAARQLGIPEGTVKSRCARGRKRLAELLEILRDGGNRS